MMMTRVSLFEAGIPEVTILIAIKAFIKKHGYAPSRRELSLFIASKEFKNELLKFGIPRDAFLIISRSLSWVYYYTRDTRQKKSILVECGAIQVDKTTRPERLYLTKLGDWISEGTWLDIHFKIHFCLGLICRKCSRNEELVLMTPNMETAYVSARGILNVDACCPKCGSSGYFTMRGIQIPQFIRFYNRVLRELRRRFKHVVAKQ